MGKPTGFMEIDRQTSREIAPEERIKNFNEFHIPLHCDEQQAQGARCMDCGVPFCQSGMMIGGMASGCPLNNLIPEWNDLVYQGRWDLAAKRLIATNRYPEFTSRVCPALCEAACTCGMATGSPVAVKENERAIVEYGYESGAIHAVPPPARTGKRVAVVGTGPSGLSVADLLNKRGHKVTMYERADRVGGLLMYGIPNMKLEKWVIDRRVKILKDEGIEFITNADVGRDVSAEELKENFDAVVLCCGAKKPREIGVPGRDAEGIYFAVDYLTSVTKSLLDSDFADGKAVTAKGKKVLVIGGGDTGNDCMGTAVRQGARTVRQLEYGPCAPEQRAASNAWPEWPNVKKTDYGQEEAIALQGDDLREWCADTQRVLLEGDGRVRGLQVHSLDWSAGKPSAVEGSEREIDAQLVLVACGFAGPEHGVFDALGVPVATTGRPLPVMECGATGAAAATHRAELAEGAAAAGRAAVYAAGDARNGSSLVVSSMADALKCAAEVAVDLGL